MGCGSSTSSHPPESVDHTNHEEIQRKRKSTTSIPCDHENEEPPPPPETDDPFTISDADWLNKRRGRRTDTEDDLDIEDEADKQVTSLKKSDPTKMMGRTTSLLDTRVTSGSHTMPVPDVSPGDVYTDPDFPFEVALKAESKSGEIQWKRPSEFCSDAVLFSDGTTRFDIEQGGAGTCWFLSILSALADKPEVIQQIIPADAYAAPGTDGYTGVFHCRLWQFGEWVDVYCDDYLPVRTRRDSSIQWGARSSDRNEMWVSLMEKAFARYQGGYNNVYGGWSGDAFVALTGGVAETVSAAKTDNFTPKLVYKRIKNSLSSGAVITCSCPASMDGQMGLAGEHAYTVTGASKIKFRAKTTSMIRVRNPWGTGKGEWKGAWSDGSEEWSEVDEEVKESLNIRGREDGEFWMTLTDYVTYFPDTHVCNFTPDFDKDGCEDGLNEVSCVLGEWRGDTAAGCDVERKMDNPRYTFTVPKKGTDISGTMSVVIQIIQRKENKETANFYLRLDLYKVDHEAEVSGTRHMVLDEMTNYTNYYGGKDFAYRYSLAPGEYLLLPTTMEPDQERQFCVRIFAHVPIPVKQVNSKPAAYIRQAEPTFVRHGTTYAMDKLLVELGAWKANVCAGGQISNKTFHTNPQYTFTITGKKQQPLLVDLLQETSDPKLSIGYKIYPIGRGMQTPLDLRTIYSINSQALKDIEGGTVFVVGYEGEAFYMAPPGEYILIPFTHEPDNEKNYALVIASSSDIKLKKCKPVKN